MIGIADTIRAFKNLLSIGTVSAADIDKAESDKYERNRKIEELTKENAELKAKLYELQSNQNNVKEENSDET